MRDDYEFGDVLIHSDVTRNTLMRWADAGIIQTSGGGSPGKRRLFTLRNLLEVQVCRELQGLGVDEPAMRQVVRNLNAIWNAPDEPINWRQPDGPKYRDASLLWLAFQRHTHPVDGSITESAITYPVTPEDLVARVTTGGAADGDGIAETGIVIPIARIISDLEARTGDTLR